MKCVESLRKKTIPASIAVVTACKAKSEENDGGGVGNEITRRRNGVAAPAAKKKKSIWRHGVKEKRKKESENGEINVIEEEET